MLLALKAYYPEFAMTLPATSNISPHPSQGDATGGLLIIELLD
jgi:hypothetical protein